MGFIHEGLPLYLLYGMPMTVQITRYDFVLQRCRGRKFRILSVHVSKTTSKRKRGIKIE